MRRDDNCFRCQDERWLGIDKLQKAWLVRLVYAVDQFACDHVSCCVHSQAEKLSRH
jgi:hypothetical protein